MGESWRDVPPHDLFGALLDQGEPFGFRDRLDATGGPGVLTGTADFLAGLSLGDIEGHSEYCEGAHGLSPGVRLPRRLA